MKSGIYFRIFQIIKNEKISVILTELIYLLFLLKFQYKRVRRTHVTLNWNSKKAFQYISEQYHNRGEKDGVSNSRVNQDVDLSIIIPVYNYREYISQCIESVRDQKTQYKYEIIIIDDGSTDGSGEIVESFNGKNIKVIHQENEGISAARNTGLGLARGKYIMFVDCDDIVDNKIVEKLMGAAYRNNADIVMCAHSRQLVVNGELKKEVLNIYPHYNLMKLNKSDAILNYAGLPWGKVYRRSLFEKVRFPQGFWYEDTIIQFLVYPQCRKFIYLPEVLYYYRWYENNYSHTQTQDINVKRLDKYWLLPKLIKQYKSMRLPQDTKFYILLLKHCSCYCYPTIKVFSKETVEATFYLLCQLVEEYRPKKKVRLPYMLQITEKAFINKDLELWKLASRYQ